MLETIRGRRRQKGGDPVDDEYTPSYAVRMKLELEAFLA